jgi:hypothetical protein
MHKLASLALVLVSMAGIVRAQDDARAIIAKGIKAQGGEDKLAQVRAGRTKLKGTLFANGQETAFTGEEAFTRAGQIRINLTLNAIPKAMTITEVFDGDKGWVSLNGQVTEANADGLARMRQQSYLSRVIWLTPLLKEKEFELSVLKESKAGERALVGVKVASKGQKDVSLYFDKESGLLTRLEYITKNNQNREVTQEDSFSNYAEVSGMKISKKSVAFQDGKKLMEVEVISAEFPETIPAKEFSKP